MACRLVGATREQTQWNVNRNLYIFIQENKFESVVRKLADIGTRLQSVNEAK